MSPDEQQKWRIEQLERRVDDLEKGHASLATIVAGLVETVKHLASQIVALWDENKWIRRLLIAAMVTVTTGAIGTATLVFIKVGGGPT